MNSDDSILQWVEEVREGNEEAAEALWNRYFPELVQRARQWLRATPQQVDDGEDVALSAMDSFFTAAKRGRFPSLDNRESLWRLLSEMTRRKVVNRIRSAHTQKQGGGLRINSLAKSNERDSTSVGLAETEDGAPSPDAQVIMREQLHLLLDALAAKEPYLKELALAKMNGDTNQELAEKFQRSIPTIERWLQRIRKIGEGILDGATT